MLFRSAHTVKGYLLGGHFAGCNVIHQMKKLTVDDLKALRDRLHIPITDEQLEANPKMPPGGSPGASQGCGTGARASSSSSSVTTGL